MDDTYALGVESTSIAASSFVCSSVKKIIGLSRLNRQLVNLRWGAERWAERWSGLGILSVFFYISGNRNDTTVIIASDFVKSWQTSQLAWINHTSKTRSTSSITLAILPFNSILFWLSLRNIYNCRNIIFIAQIIYSL